MRHGETDLARAMRTVAQENLAAAFLLLDRSLLRAAASRFYFAALQAAVYALERQGRRPADFRDPYWTHRTVAFLVPGLWGRKADGMPFREIRNIRVTADYKERRLERWELERIKHDVRRFVEETTA